MESFYKPLLIAGKILPGNLFLAPMAGYTDRAFRHLCLEQGADICYTEMVSCEGMFRDSAKTYDLLIKAENETDCIFQLFGSDPDHAFHAAEAAVPLKPFMIDLNSGCPVPKVVNSGCGSALMKNPSEIFKMVDALRRGLDAGGGKDIPVSIKIRSGWNSDQINFIDAAKAARDAGAALIGLHPRTRVMGYSGTAVIKYVAELKNNIDIPVIASGDLYSPEAVLNMFKETGCDGVMIARGAVGQPWIFRQIKELLIEGNVSFLPGPDLRFETAFDHLKLTMKYYNENYACKEMKKHFCAYTKGIQGGGNLRNQLVHCSTFAEFEQVFSQWKAKE